ncbi:addiction module antidote protein, HigA family [Canicola haemoglobinophilus]|uniref:Plasmid maintenance system antidote protein, XRE family/addiction module antidote protein, HigA family/PSEEN1946 proteic killer active protein n=1 Tax=Canicola haemoglobinophilus TaxID=733 RepID=A0A1V4B208_9PAST|nr:HigA family addiction module antitoxin [Canicola haemoglobinophilus]OOS01254.1 addiction module antidote protein, HigA family [Canicola haemoglobinophilus]STO54432.1 plasmid maintenance system antidote protein, XRE family/addiction module antidote protein, HigA family/PSEEN1946 proteic killer active protein [Canicola haemoglobinophilus]STO60094.1 plasmid maintenance system antidote protein, XRE family/addiction module antidote protein, HigA family/PSEEN1946 proteic killer active protein [Cani
MRKPAHPGQILLDGFIEPNNIKIKDLAEHLGFSRETLSRVLNGKTPITTNLALSLEEAGIGSAKLWLNLQTKYDLWEIKQHRTSLVTPYLLVSNYA